MFIGHYAVALAAKKVAPRTSLGSLVLAAQFVDLLWPILILLGLEHVRIVPGTTAVTPLDFYDYPFTHSLAAALLWSALFAGVYFALKKYREGAFVVGGAVFSHWLLDLVSHRPDLPVAPGVDIRLGFGLWNSVAATVIVETALFLGGIALYLRATEARDRTGVVAFWGLMAVLYGISVANLLGPPPPSVPAIGYAGVFAWLFVAWAFWVDRHRTLRVVAA